MYGNDLVEWGRFPALSATEGIMDAGLLNNVYPGAVDVRFVEIVNNPNDPRFNGNEPKSDGNGSGDSDQIITRQPEDDKMKVWPWAVAGALGLLVVGALVARRRRRNVEDPVTSPSYSDNPIS